MHRALFWHRNTHVLRKRRVPKLQKAALFAIVCRFFVWHRASFWQPLQPWFVKETAFFFAKAQNSGFRVVPDFGTGCRFYAQSFVYAAQSFGGKACHPRPTLLPPLQPWFVKETEFFSAKAQKLKNSAKPNSGTVCRFSMEGSCIGFWKSKANSTFCKVVKQKGETFWQPLQPWFVKETAFFSAKAQNSRIRRNRILGIVCRFSPWNVFPPMKPAVWGFGLGL